MGKASYQPALWVQSCSGWISIFNRFRGTVPVETRAARFTKELESGPGTRRDLAVLQVRHDYEVIGDDENANLETVRAAQIRFLALADEYRIVDEIVENRLQRAPIAKFFAAIVAQGYAAGATEVEMVLPDPASDSFPIRYLIRGEWETAMAAPTTLFPALRGFSHFVLDAQYAGLRERLPKPEQMPLDLKVDLREERAIRIKLTA
jgi:hypothetical protein